MIIKDLERIRQIEASLGENQLDAFVFFHPDNILMATGMLPGSTYTVALVSADGKVVVITPWWREAFVQQESWTDEILTFDWCRGFNGVEPISAMRKLLEESSKKSGLEKIGYDAKMHHYSPNKLPSEFFIYEEIKQLLPEIFVSAIDATDIINQLKSIKTKREIEKLRITNTVAAAGVKAFYASARPGVRETDLAAEVNYAVLKMAGRHGIHYTYCDPPQIASGRERTLIADTLSNHATERSLQQGDLVLLEFGLHADGYWADITRTLVVGVPTDRQFSMHEAVVSAQRNAIDSYRPGKSTGDELCQTAWEALRESGFGEGITHLLGHGLGFAYHEDRPILGPGESVIVRPGHVTSVEPGIYWRVGDEFIGGIRVEDNVVWGEKPGQVELLSDFFRGLSIP